MTVYIEKPVYKKFLDENILFVNHLNKKDSKNNNDEYLKKNSDVNAQSGLYITDFFLKKNESKAIGADSNINYQFSKIYEDKELIEKYKTNGYNTTGIRLLSDDYEEKIYNDLYKEDNITTDKPQNNGYFFFVFPLVILDKIYLLFLNFKILPFEIQGKLINNGSIISTTYEKVKNINNEYFETRLFEVKNKSLTYTDFIKGFYSSTFKATDFSEILMENVNISNDYAIAKNVIGNIIITPKKDESLNIDNEQQNVTKNIQLFDVRSASDARYVYWEKCINNNSKFDENDSSINFANYYDISFDCKHLKSFCFSNYTPGYYVIDYKPDDIYMNISFNNQNVKTIDLLNVYNEIFDNKIINVKIDAIT